jgi:ATP/ADP translocase
MAIISLIIFIIVLALWIIRLKNLFSIKDNKKYEASRDDLIDEIKRNL